jgi:hypothetical protein
MREFLPRRGATVLHIDGVEPEANIRRAIRALQLRNDV